MSFPSIAGKALKWSNSLLSLKIVYFVFELSYISLFMRDVNGKSGINILRPVRGNFGPVTLPHPLPIWKPEQSDGNGPSSNRVLKIL